jgi:hypothetical protein
MILLCHEGEAMMLAIRHGVEHSLQRLGEGRRVGCQHPNLAAAEEGAVVAERGGDVPDEAVGDTDSRFEVGDLDSKDAFLAAVDRVETADEASPVKDREGVVAVPAFRFGRIDLDAVLETEERLSAAAVSDQIVEGREKGGQHRSTASGPKLGEDR